MIAYVPEIGGIKLGYSQNFSDSLTLAGFYTFKYELQLNSGKQVQTY